MDVLAAGAGALAALPAMSAIAVAIKLTSKGPVLYWSERVGQDNRIFRMPKFRTMRTDTPAVATHLLDDPARFLTPIGGFLRKTSLDELPQLWNILKGDMSIVGPRPALPREVEQYGDYEKQRLYVTPGLSCYWQIAPHRNDLSFEEWMDLDVKYVKERSFWVDWKIIFKTFKVCLLGHGE